MWTHEYVYLAARNTVYSVQHQLENTDSANVNNIIFGFSSYLFFFFRFCIFIRSFFIPDAVIIIRFVMGSTRIRRFDTVGFAPSDRLWIIDGRCVGLSLSFRCGYGEMWRLQRYRRSVVTLLLWTCGKCMQGVDFRHCKIAMISFFYKVYCYFL